MWEGSWSNIGGGAFGAIRVMICFSSQNKVHGEVNPSHTYERRYEARLNGTGQTT